MQEAWEGFKEGIWTGEVDVRDFIQKNYTPYEGDESFLVGPTERTKELWGEVLDLLLKEREQGGVLDMDTKIVTGIVSHPAGYIDNAHREKETIVGLQTDKPLKRALQRYVESPLSVRLLKGEFERDDSILIDVDGNELSFSRLEPAEPLPVDEEVSV